MKKSDQPGLPGLKTFMVLFFMAITTFGHSRSRSDSLLKLLSEASHDTTRIGLLFKTGNLFVDGPSDSLIHYYKRSMNLIDSNLHHLTRHSYSPKDPLFNKYKHLKFRALIELGIENLFLNRYHKSIEYYEDALSIAEEMQDINLLSEVYGELGIVYKNQGNYAKSLEYYEKTLPLAIEIGDSSWIAACYANIGNVYRRLTKYSRALDYFLKAIRIFEEMGEKRRIAITFMNIGNLYEDQNDLNKALDYFQKALTLSFETGDYKRTVECLMNIGSIHSAGGDLELARKYFMRSMDLSEEKGFTHVLDDTYKDLGITWEKEGHYNIAIEYYTKAIRIAESEGDLVNLSEILGYMARVYLLENDLEKAIGYAERSLKAGEETKDPQSLRNAYLYLSRAWEKNGNMNRALAYHKLFAQFKDTIFNAEKYKVIAEMEMKYETEKKEQELTLLAERNENQQLEINRRNRIISVSVIFILLLVVTGYVVFRNNRLISRQKALELEQKLLRAQMNPHFIFNSLIAIQSFIYKKDAIAAGDYLAKFADLVRITLENTRNEFVLLERELKMLKIYLDLQMLRFQDKFVYTLEVDDKINPETVRIPPMLAQPFIENSIEHGLRYKDEKGHIRIAFEMENGYILFMVEDNGIGRQAARELESKKNHQSMATSITCERLEALGKKFRQTYTMELTDLKDRSDIATGTRVKFTMPFLPVS